LEIRKVLGVHEKWFGVHGEPPFEAATHSTSLHHAFNTSQLSARVYKPCSFGPRPSTLVSPKHETTKDACMDQHIQIL